jgi:hypothetical protein
VLHRFSIDQRLLQDSIGPESVNYLWQQSMMVSPVAEGAPESVSCHGYDVHPSGHSALTQVRLAVVSCTLNTYWRVIGLG